MLRSMYAGVAGMKGFQTKLDVIGNNIANVNTIGYKKSTINFQDLLSQNLSDGGVNPMQVGLGSATSTINVVHTPGPSMSTGVGTDLAILGDGFFVVQKPDSEEQYLTRAGNFIANAAGELVTSQGYNVLNSDEAIIEGLNDFDSFTINRLGEVIGKDIDGTETSLGFIGISVPDNPSGLKKFAGSMYEMTSKADADGIDIGDAALYKSDYD